MQTKITLWLTGVLPSYNHKKTGALPIPAIIEQSLSASAGHNWQAKVVSGLALLMHKYTGSKDVKIGLPQGRALAICIDEPAQTSFANLVSGVTKLLEQEQSLTWSEMPDLLLHCISKEEGLLVQAEYDVAVYAEDTIRRFLAHLDALLCSAAEDEDRSLATINILPEAEARLIRELFNATAVSYDNGTYSLKKLLALAVEQYAQCNAVIMGNRILTYAEFGERAAKLAAVLVKKGVKSGDLVAVMAARSIDTLVGIYAIVLCCAAYLPVDSNYPEARKQYMLQDSGAGFLLHEAATKARPGGCQAVMISLNAWQEASAPYDAAPDTSPQSLAYLIYTSGSTGQPKGVMIEQQSLINRLNWMQRRYPIQQGDVILHKTSFSFDVSVWELFWWMLTGASVCLMEPQTERFCDSIAACIHAQKITVIHFVPSMLAIFLDFVEEMDVADDLRSLRQVFASGEALQGATVEKFYRLLPWCRLSNLYGPTEATIDVTYYDCPRENIPENIPIGKPIDNMRVYIVDDNLLPLPVGVSGELCIGGIGLARGYINKEELTRSQFVQPAWLTERLYKTGDIARWLPDGNILFLGRRDAQVKVRGYRIELNEIEYNLQKHPSIRHAIVIAKPDTDSGENELIAYVIADKQMESRELAGYLARTLPDFMVPAYFVQIETIPLTANHKLDKKALPDPHKMAL